MPNVFVISDTHFGHSNIIAYANRPFANVIDMDETMIANWNNVVKPQDKVYHLGDVVINRRFLPSVMPRLNGTKVLIKGNHDIFKLKDYLPWFKDIRAYHKIDWAILSHIPIHPDQIGRFARNVHGHLHDKRVRLTWDANNAVMDERYVNVCVEQINYTPVELGVLYVRLGQ